MIKVQYRIIFDDGTVSRWHNWKQCHSQKIAIVSLLRHFYPYNSEATVENFFNVSLSSEEPIYELIEPFNPRDLQFCFVEIPSDSPWEIGLIEALKGSNV